MCPGQRVCFGNSADLIACSLDNLGDLSFQFAAQSDAYVAPNADIVSNIRHPLLCIDTAFSVPIQLKNGFPVHMFPLCSRLLFSFDVPLASCLLTPCTISIR